MIHPHSPGGPLPCVSFTCPGVRMFTDAIQFLQSAKHADVAAVYGENFSRLERVKAMIDPEHTFKHSFWPRPGAPTEERQLAREGTGIPVKDLANGVMEDLQVQQGNAPSGVSKGKGRAYDQAGLYDNITDFGNAISGKTAEGMDGAL